MRAVDVGVVSPARLESLIGSERDAALRTLAAEMTERLQGRTVWNISSTAVGGGVAEMLQVLLAYGVGAGVQAKWLVIDGDPDFFAITKRIHNRLHGAEGGSGALGDAEQEHYQAVLESNLPQLLDLIHREDVVILHDPQTVGLAAALAEHGVAVIWRCHVGNDITNQHSDQAWAFLRPFLESAKWLVFSRAEYAPSWVDRSHLTIIAPAIDPFSVKNAEMDSDVVNAILDRAGIVAPSAGGAKPEFERADGTTGTVSSTADVVREGDPISVDVPMVVQVSRWDRLKDMPGVMNAFAEHVVPSADADGVHLALVGPSVAGVTDDPEGQEVLAECTQLWQGLRPEVRRRISLISLPTEDSEENAAVVNAIQRHATVVVQKSLVEGFGLTVAEAMWKSRPVVASAVGGILDQIDDGEQGILVQDPTDLAECGAALREILGDPEHAARIGAAARARVNERFLPDRELTQWAHVIGAVDARG